jgi:hypothetical protein
MREVGDVNFRKKQAKRCSMKTDKAERILAITGPNHPSKMLPLGRKQTLPITPRKGMTLCG